MDGRKKFISCYDDKEFEWMLSLRDLRDKKQWLVLERNALDTSENILNTILERAKEGEMQNTQDSLDTLMRMRSNLQSFFISTLKDYEIISTQSREELLNEEELTSVSEYKDKEFKWISEQRVLYE